MLGRVIYGDQRLFINGMEMSGVQSNSSSLDTNYVPIFVAGTGVYSQEPSGPTEYPFSFERVVFETDPLTGVLFSGLSGHFAYATGNSTGYQTFGFENGLITSYSISCAVGDLAKSSVDIAARGNMGSFNDGIDIATGAEYNSPFIGKPGDLHISGYSDGETNRVQSIEYTLTIPYTSNDKIGTAFGPDSRRLTGPITISTKFSIEVQDFRQEDLFSLICDTAEKNLYFYFTDCDNTTVRAFNAPRSKLKSSSYNADVGTNLSFDITYQGYVNSTGEAIACLNGNGI